MHTEVETELDPAPGPAVSRLHSADDVRMDMLVLLGVERSDAHAAPASAGARLDRRLARWTPSSDSGDVTVESRGSGPDARRGPARVPTPVRRVPARPSAGTERTDPVLEVTAPTVSGARPLRRVPVEDGIAVPVVLLPWLVASMLALATGVGLLMMLAGALLMVAILA